jgi:hypothetical protein
MATNADFIRLGAKLFLEQCPLYPRLGRELEDTDLPQKPLLRRNHPGDKGKTALDSVPGLSRVRYGDLQRRRNIHHQRQAEDWGSTRAATELGAACDEY